MLLRLKQHLLSTIGTGTYAGRNHPRAAISCPSAHAAL